MYYKKSAGEKVCTGLIYILCIVLTLAFLYPVVYCLSMSVSDAEMLGGQPIGILPKGFSLEAYQYLLSSSKVFRYYANTILYAGLGTLITLLTTSLIAYPLSVSTFSGRKVLTVYLVITMFFSGGMVPTYLNIQRLGLMDTIWVMVLPSAVGAYSVMVYKTFFKQLPSSLTEAAKIDGAGHFRILFTIVLPLSKPLLATMALFSIVGHWNSFLNAVMYLRSSSKHPIQMMLRSLLISLEMVQDESMAAVAKDITTSTRTVKGAGVMIAIIPILCIYPFLQKYFAKGVMIGSIKE